jgi:nicotinamidase-related amidase
VVEPAPWEAFQTARDRALTAAFPPRRRLPPSRAVLLSVDNYRAGVGDRRLPMEESVHQWPSSTGLAGWAALDRIAVLMAACRRVGVPVVHVVGLPPERSGIPSWRAGGGGRREAVDGGPEALSRRLAGYDVVPQAAPQAAEPVLVKSAPSAFFGTPLAALLTALRCRTVIVVGQSTSGCVRATVTDAASCRLSVVVPLECVYDRSESSHAVNLFDMHDKYADVVPLDDLLTELSRYAEGTG